MRNEENKFESYTCDKKYIPTNNKIFLAAMFNSPMEKIVCNFCFKPHLSKHYNLTILEKEIYMTNLNANNAYWKATKPPFVKPSGLNAIFAIHPHILQSLCQLPNKTKSDLNKK